jgi:hypothetical protein
MESRHTHMSYGLIIIYEYSVVMNTAANYNGLTVLAKIFLLYGFSWTFKDFSCLCL